MTGSGLRFWCVGVSVLLGASLQPASLLAQADGSRPSSACVGVRDGRGGHTLRHVIEEEPCRPSEARVPVYVRHAQPFMETPVRQDGLFVSTLLTSTTQVHHGGRLLVRLSVLVDLDQTGRFALRNADGRVTSPTSVRCGLVMDGTSFTADAGGMPWVDLSLGLGATDPTHGDGGASADAPNVLMTGWFTIPNATRGVHEFAAVCRTRTATRLAGEVALTVLEGHNVR